MDGVYLLVYDILFMVLLLLWQMVVLIYVPEEEIYHPSKLFIRIMTCL